MHLRGPCISPTTYITAREEDHEEQDEDDHEGKDEYDHEGHDDDDDGHEEHDGPILEDRGAHLSEYHMIDERYYIWPSGKS